MYIALIVLFGGAVAVWWFSAGGPSTLTSNGMEQKGGSGILEKIFFGIFGAPRDIQKEQATLSWQKKPVAPPPHRDGFCGRGAHRRW